MFHQPGFARSMLSDGQQHVADANNPVGFVVAAVVFFVTFWFLALNPATAYKTFFRFDPKYRATLERQADGSLPYTTYSRVLFISGAVFATVFLVAGIVAVVQ